MAPDLIQGKIHTGFRCEFEGCMTPLKKEQIIKHVFEKHGIKRDEEFWNDKKWINRI